VNTGHRITGSYDLGARFVPRRRSDDGYSYVSIESSGFYPQTVADTSPTPNGYLLLPGYVNHDLAIFKNVPIWGERRLQFRLEMFNFLNATEFSGRQQGHATGE